MNPYMHGAARATRKPTPVEHPLLAAVRDITRTEMTQVGVKLIQRINAAAQNRQTWIERREAEMKQLDAMVGDLCAAYDASDRSRFAAIEADFNKLTRGEKLEIPATFGDFPTIDPRTVRAPEPPNRETAAETGDFVRWKLSGQP